MVKFAAAGTNNKLVYGDAIQWFTEWERKREKIRRDSNKVCICLPLVSLSVALEDKNHEVLSSQPQIRNLKSWLNSRE